MSDYARALEEINTLKTENERLNAIIAELRAATAEVEAPKPVRKRAASVKKSKKNAKD